MNCPRCDREAPPFTWLPHRCPEGVGKFEYADDEDALINYWQMLWTGAMV